MRPEAPKPYAEPRPAPISAEGLDAAGRKIVNDENARRLKVWQDAKREHDAAEKIRVQQEFQINKTIFANRELAERTAAGQKATAELQARSQAAVAERTARGQENAAAISAAGRRDAEAIKVRGEERGREAKRTEETEKANPNWQRNRRLEAEADPLSRAATGAMQSTVSMQDGADIGRAADNKRAAIAYESAPKADAYMKEKADDRVGGITTQLANLGEKDPQNITRYKVLVDRVAQRNDMPTDVLTNLVYGMVTNRWADGDQPRVRRDGMVTYKGSEIVMPPDVLMTIVAENGRRTLNSDRATIKARDEKIVTDEKQAQRNVSNAKRDLDNTTDLVREGASAGADIGFDGPARSPRFQAIPVDPTRFRK
jgi:hypothetical protein